MAYTSGVKNVLKAAKKKYVEELKAKSGSFAIVKVAKLLEATGIPVEEARGMAQEIVAGEREMPANVDVPVQRVNLWNNAFVLTLITIIAGPMIAKRIFKR